MKDFAEKVFTQLPGYVGRFAQLVARPKTTLAEWSAGREGDLGDAFLVYAATGAGGGGGGGGGDRPVAGDHESARSAASGLGRGDAPEAFPDGSCQSPLAPPPDPAFL